jgi:hypothetical protein
MNERRKAFTESISGQLLTFAVKHHTRRFLGLSTTLGAACSAV